MPWGLLLAAAGLLALGWIGIARGEELGDGDGRFVHQQILWSLVAAGAILNKTLLFSAVMVLGKAGFAHLKAKLFRSLASTPEEVLVMTRPQCRARMFGSTRSVVAITESTMD